jgi:hypothetical protein
MTLSLKYPKKIRFFAFAAFFLTLNSCNKSEHNFQEAWNKANAPSQLNLSFSSNFEELPLSGKTEYAPWSDTYWPSNLGGIGARWQSWFGANSLIIPKTSPVPTRTDRISAKQLSSEQISMLSPAEKYDLLVGKFGFPLLDAERSRVSEKAQGWEGLCNGWASASLIFQEPVPQTVQNSQGQQITFTSADIKGLLAYYMAQANEGQIRVLGARCNHDLKKTPDARFRSECKDTNAGSFHISLSNLLGIQKKGLLADIFRDTQVWNQPVFEYESNVVETLPKRENSAPETTTVLKIITKIVYADELPYPVAEPVLGTHFQKTTERSLEYYLELNSKREIIGGEWISDFRPDFIWIQELAEMTGYWKPLSQLIKVKK